MADSSNRNSESSRSSGGDMGDNRTRRNSESSGVGEIVGAIVGGVALGAAAIGLIAYFLKNRNNQERNGVERNIRVQTQRLNEERQRQAMLQDARIREQQQMQERDRQATLRHATLMKEGHEMFKEGWEAERNSKTREAEFKFQTAKKNFDMACQVKPTATSSLDWAEICSLKIQGNTLFNEGIELQKRGNASEESTGFYKAAWNKFVEAKRVFEEGWIKSKDEGFQENIAIVEESLLAAEELLNLDDHVEAEDEDEERELGTEHDERCDLVSVVEKKQA